MDQWVVKAKVKDATYGRPFEISFDKHVGVDFGWVTVDKNGKPILRPNIMMEYRQTELKDKMKYVMKDGSRGILSRGGGKITDIVKDGVVKERTLKKVSKVPEPNDTDEVEPKTHAGTHPSTDQYWKQTNKNQSGFEPLNLEKRVFWGTYAGCT